MIRSSTLRALPSIAAMALSACGGSQPLDSALSPPPSRATTAPRAPLPAQVIVGDEVLELRTAAGRVEIHRAPIALRVVDAGGREVLASAPTPALGAQPRLLDLPRAPGGVDLPEQAPLYAPFSFLVGQVLTLQFPATFWTANLLASGSLGIEYRLDAVESVTPTERGFELQVSTTDPSGRMAVLRVESDENETFAVSLRLAPVNQQIALVGAAFASGEGEAFRGFGGRRNALDQRGFTFVNWAEEFHQTPEQVPVAENALFREHFQFPTGPQGAYYVQSLFHSPRGYGVLLDRDELSVWRMASDRDDAWQVDVAGGALDLVIAPGNPAQTVEKLSGLNGRHRLPPRWALGPMLSEAVIANGDSTADYRARVEESLQMIEDLELPVSAFLFEGWFGLQDEGVLEDVIARLRAQGIRPVTYFKAFVDSSNGPFEEAEVFETALAEGLVAQTALGTPFLFGSPLGVGGDLAALIDFTHPAARTRWRERLRFALDLGIEGWMQDFGEQSFAGMVFADGSTGIEMHNRYARLYHQTTREVLDDYLLEHPEREPWFFVRNGSSGRPGSAAFESASWSGDNTADWSRASGIGSIIPDMLNRSVGGAYGFVSEIGGYIDTFGRPPKELFIRWAQLASLSPVHRVHGGPVNGTHMPWRYDAETVEAWRVTAQRHIAAQPLILELWREAFETGMPITRPLWLAYPDDPQAAKQDQQFLLGSEVLVAPVVTPGATSRTVYFPNGCWRHPETGDTFEGPASIEVEAPITQLPYYFRCGTAPFPVPDGGF